MREIVVSMQNTLLSEAVTRSEANRSISNNPSSNIERWSKQTFNNFISSLSNT